jgi:hypothetical protein
MRLAPSARGLPNRLPRLTELRSPFTFFWPVAAAIGVVALAGPAPPPAGTRPTPAEALAGLLLGMRALLAFTRGVRTFRPLPIRPRLAGPVLAMIRPGAGRGRDDAADAAQAGAPPSNPPARWRRPWSRSARARRPLACWAAGFSTRSSAMSSAADSNTPARDSSRSWSR